MLKSLGNTCFLTDFKKSVGDGEDVLISESSLIFTFLHFQQLQLFGNYQYLMQDVAITLMVCLTSKIFSKENHIVFIYP